MRTLLAEYIDDFERRGDAIAFVQRRGLRKHRWTYSQVAMQARLFVQELEANHIHEGDRVLLCGHNSAEWVAAFFACLLRGAISVPLDVQSDPTFVERIRKQTDAKLAFMDSTTANRIKLDLPLLSLEGEPPSENGLVRSSFTGSEDDVAEIVFTSGTSSDPKGVRITNGNLLANLLPLEREIEHYLKWERLVHPLRFLNLLPLSHIFGQFMGVFVPQMLGAEVFFENKLHTSQIISTIRNERISVVVCVPRQLEMLREAVERHYHDRARWFAEALAKAEGWSPFKRWWVFRDVHRLFGIKFWAFISGGATLSSEVEEFWQRLGFVVIQGYGMTETASLISVNHPFKRGRGSIGKILKGQEVKLATDGEILVRGGNISPGYWTTDKPANLENGWFATGDIGEFDAEGNLYFRGRKKDVIVTSAGMNVYPEDIEQALRREPQVKDAIVIPFPSSHGAEVFAVMTLQAQTDDPKSIITRVNSTLASHQQILHWFVWPEPDFPRTSTGKIKKHEVSNRLTGAALTNTISDQPSVLQQLISRVGGDARDTLDRNATLSTDLKLDSLGRVELLAALEDHYQVDIDEAAVSSATTVADLENVVRERQAKAEDIYPYPRWAMRFPLKLLRLLLLYLVVFPLTRIMGRPTVKGAENLSAIPGPLLFVANHMAMVDHALVLWSLPGRFRRRMSIAMDGELLREWLHPSTGTSWFTRWRQRVQYFLVVLFFNVFSMPHHGSFRRSFAFAGEVIDDRYSVLVFPEGRRSTDGKLHAFKSGIGLLAQGLAVPVVPIRIDGLWELGAQQRKFARPGEVTVRIGAPIVYPVTHQAETIARDLEQRVAKL